MTPIESLEEAPPDAARAAHADLIGRAQNREIAAFEELYRAQVSRVYGLCLRLSADPVRAEELTQDVFVRLWEKIGSFRGQSAFTTWLHRLTVNVVLDQARSDTRRASRVTTTDDLASVHAESRESLPGVRLDLERAIARLPGGAREVFVLHDIEGYRHAEIAELAGIAEGTSKAQLHRARRLLREVLEP